MKAILVTIALTLAGCSGLQSPVPTPVPVSLLPPQVVVATKMICSSPVANTDPRVMAGCMVLQSLPGASQ